MNKTSTPAKRSNLAFINMYMWHGICGEQSQRVGHWKKKLSKHPSKHSSEKKTRRRVAILKNSGGAGILLYIDEGEKYIQQSIPRKRRLPFKLV